MYRNLLRQLMLAFGLLCFLGAPAQANLAGITLGGELFSIDPQTGDEVFVGSTGYVGTNGLARDPASGELLSVSIRGLIRIDPATAAATLIGGTIFSLQGLAYSPQGVLYGVRNPRSLDPGGLRGPDLLVRVDLTTGIQTDVGSLGGPFKSGIQALSFLGDTLYGWDLRATSGLLTIDPLTGLGTELPGGTDVFQDMQAMGASADGTFIWGMGRSSAGGLARIDPVTGDQLAVLPPLANLYRGIEDVGVAGGMVPEPGAAVLYGSGLLTLALHRRRPAAGRR